MRSGRGWFSRPAVLVGLGLSACGGLGGDDQVAKNLAMVEPAAYWSVRGKVEDKTYIRPIVRFRIKNNGSQAAEYIQAMAVFRRESAPDQSWGNAFLHAVPGGAVAPAAVSEEVTLRADSNYYSTSEPEKMFENKEWEEVVVEVFLKVRSSQWISMGKVEVPRRLGAPGVEQFTSPPPPPAR